MKPMRSRSFVRALSLSFRGRRSPINTEPLVRSSRPASCIMYLPEPEGPMMAVAVGLEVDGYAVEAPDLGFAFAVDLVGVDRTGGDTKGRGVWGRVPWGSEEGRHVRHDALIGLRDRRPGDGSLVRLW